MNAKVSEWAQQLGEPPRAASNRGIGPTPAPKGCGARKARRKGTGWVNSICYAGDS